MPKVTLIYSYTNVIPKMNYSTEHPRPNLRKEVSALSDACNDKIYQSSFKSCSRLTYFQKNSQAIKYL